MANNLFDGTNFTRLDDNAIGDGTGSTTEVLDTWLENLVDNNARYLWRKGSSVTSWRPRPAEGAQILASANWATWFQFPMTVEPSLTDLVIVIEGGTVNGDMNFRARFRKPGGGTIDESETGANANDLRKITLSPTGSDIEKERIAIFELEIKSETRVDSTSTKIGVKIDTSNVDLSKGAIPLVKSSNTKGPVDGMSKYDKHTTSPQPAEDKGIYLAEDTDDDGTAENFQSTPAEVMASWNKEDGSKTIIIGHNPNADKNQQSQTAWLTDISSFEAESLTLKKKYDETVSDRNWTAKTSGSMQPNEVPKGRQTSQHPDNLDSVHGRTRSKQIGTPRVARLDPSTENGSFLDIHPTDRNGIRIDTDETVLIAHLIVAPILVTDQNFDKAADFPANDDLRATWEFQLKLRGYTDESSSLSDFGTATTKLRESVDKGWIHGPTTGTAPQFPILQRAHFEEHDLSSGSESVYRKNLTYNRLGKDTEYLVPVQIRLDADDIDGTARRREVPALVEIGGRVTSTGSNVAVGDVLCYVFGYHLEEESTVEAT